MESSEFFAFRCSSCAGRSRAAVAYAGQYVICPHCSAQVVAQDVAAANGTIAYRQGGNQVPTQRVARPLGGTTGSIRRAGNATQELMADFQPATRPTPPGMAGFAESRATASTANPATSSRHRRPAAAGATLSRPVTVPATHPGTSAHGVIASLIATVICAGVAIWAFTEASGSQRAARRALSERDQARDELALLKVQSESVERRLAQTQTELAAARAVATREREVSTNLQVAVDRLSESLARSRAPVEPGLSMIPTPAALMAALTPGAFPNAAPPAAGIPATRREVGKP